MPFLDLVRHSSATKQSVDFRGLKCFGNSGAKRGDDPQKFGLFLQDFMWCDPNGANQAPVAPPVKETSPKGMDTLASTSLLFAQCLSLEL